MKSRIKWVEGAMFVGETASGHAVVMDGPVEGGGRNLGPRPMEMLLLGVGACTAYDVVSILQKARQPIVSCEIEVDTERADSAPKVFTKMHLHYVVTGKAGLKEAQVQKAIELSKEKYCSASIMLGKAVPITYDFVIHHVE